MARSGSFDHVAINSQGREATWQLEERPIAQGFTTVDLHLCEGGTWQDLIHRIAF